MKRAVLLVLLTAACTRPEPAVLQTCPIDPGMLANCRYPADLPDDPVDAILRLYEALSICVEINKAAAQTLSNSPKP